MICPSCQIDNESGSEACFGCGKSLTALTLGTLISGRYEIESLLGKGGMGVVYRAHDQLLDEPVAIKVLRSEFVDTPEVAQRFRSEIKLARKVSHPNVCRIHEYGVDGTTHFISMALIEGTDLSQLVRQNPDGLPTDAAFTLAIQVTDGLQAIHDVGIIHRDLKSSNIICDGSGLARLMDFGIAKDSAGKGQLTATGQVMGTPEYMSPEQCHGGILDYRSDVYSLGIVLYEIFIGRVPFRGETLMSTLLKQVQDEAPLGSLETVGVPAGVVATLRKALAKDPAERFATAAEVAAALRAARDAPEAEPTTEAEAEAPVAAESASEDPQPSGVERRRDTRLPISLDVILQRASAGGSILQEERTIADNVGRHGARVLTTMTSINRGDTVNVRQVDGDFQSRSAVRHVHTGTDLMRKLGLEFLDRSAPDHLVPNDGSKPRITQGVPRPQPAQPAAPVPPPVSAPPSPAREPVAAERTEDRRKDSRLSISIDLRLRRLSPSGVVLEEERTIADNVGRHGARVLSALQGLTVGEILLVQEVGTDFETRAEVRAVYPGPDRIQRVGLQYLDRATPTRLIPDGDSKPRLGRPAEAPKAPVVAAPPGPPSERRKQVLAAFEGIKTQNHFEVLGLPRASNATQVKDAYFKLARLYHADVKLEADVVDLKREVGAIYNRIGEAYETLIDLEKRSAYESRLGRSRPAPAGPPVVTQGPSVVPPPPPPAPPPPPVAAPPPPLDADSSSRLAMDIVNKAKALLADAKVWDAIQMLEGGQHLAPGTRTNQMLRLVLAQATARNPRWRKRAEEMLVELSRETPPPVEALIALSDLYQEEGFKARAAAQLRRVVELQPGHADALARLRALD